MKRINVWDIERARVRNNPEFYFFKEDCKCLICDFRRFEAWAALRRYAG